VFPFVFSSPVLFLQNDFEFKPFYHTKGLFQMIITFSQYFCEPFIRSLGKSEQMTSPKNAKTPHLSMEEKRGLLIESLIMISLLLRGSNDLFWDYVQ